MSTRKRRSVKTVNAIPWSAIESTEEALAVPAEKIKKPKLTRPSKHFFNICKDINLTRKQVHACKRCNFFVILTYILTNAFLEVPVAPLPLSKSTKPHTVSVANHSDVKNAESAGNIFYNFIYITEAIQNICQLIFTFHFTSLRFPLT